MRCSVPLQQLALGRGHAKALAAVHEQNAHSGKQRHEEEAANEHARNSECRN